MAQTDLRVVKTLRQIDRALADHLAHTPFEKITVEQLCRTALINRSTFYKYYDSKYDLMEQYLGRALDSFRKQVDVAFVNASPDRIHNLVYQKSFENTLRFLHKHKTEYTTLWSIPLEHGVFERMTEVVRDAILDNLPGGREQAAPYADLYARLFATDMMTIVRWWLLYEDRISEQDVQNLMRDNMRQGMFRTFRQLMQ